MRRVYIDAPLRIGGVTTLSDSAFHYLFRVLRCREGESVMAFNGDGHDYVGLLEQCSKKSATLTIHKAQVNHNESPIYMILLQGLSKGDRMDVAIQKAVELGVNEIYPVQTEFCAVKRNDARQEKRQQHWQAIIRSACEQCERAVIPVLHPLMPLTDVLPLVDATPKLLLHPYAENNQDDNQARITPLNKLNEMDSNGRVALLVGPEGGLSDNEVHAAEQQQFTRLTLGTRILRTETATISALTLIQYLWGDYAQ